MSLFVMLMACTTACSGKKSKDMKASDIVSLIKKGKDVTISDKVIFGDLDLTDFEKYQVLAFPNMETHIPVNVVFMNCVFMGKVSTTGKMSVNGSKRKVDVFSVFEKNLTFFACDFRGEVVMDEMVVNGRLEFSNSVFRENVSMNSLYAKGPRVGFLEIECEKEFSMCFARFLADANFMDAKFHQRANFMGMRAKGLQFSNAQFGADADFSNSIFAGDVAFNYIKCAGNLQFSFSKFMGDYDLLKSVSEGDCSFERSLFFGRMRLNKSEFKAGVETKEATSIFVPVTDEARFSSGAPKWSVAKMEQIDLK